MRPKKEHHTLINDIISIISLRHENEAKAPESDNVIICMIKFKIQHSCRGGGGGERFDDLSLQTMTKGKFFNDITNINWDTMMNVDQRSPFK